MAVRVVLADLDNPGIKEAFAQITVNLFRLHICDSRNLLNSRPLHLNFKSVQQAVANYQDRQQRDTHEPDRETLREGGEFHGFIPATVSSK